jgi:hypothetical protein
MTVLSGSVGDAGLNRRDDVLVVQQLLNEKFLSAGERLVLDGICGVKTITAIRRYQLVVVGMNPSDGRIDPGGPTLRSLIGEESEDNVRFSMRFFVGKGWSIAQAAGIVANLKVESEFNPAASGDGGLAYGIAQWHPDRQSRFGQMIPGGDLRGSTFEQQLEFVDFELTKSGEIAAGNRLRAAVTAFDAGSIVSLYYERPANRDVEANRRGRLAESIASGFRL